MQQNIITKIKPQAKEYFEFTNGIGSIPCIFAGYLILWISEGKLI